MTSPVFYRARTHWTDEDLYLLQDLVRRKTPMATMRRILGRSTAALRHAIHKMFFYQLLNGTADDLLSHYNLNKESLAGFLVQDKYDVPLEDSDADADTDDADEQSISRMSQFMCMATTVVMAASSIALCVAAAVEIIC